MRKTFHEITAATRGVGKAFSSTEDIIIPIRESLFKRFPIVGIMLGTFGLTATLYGLEQMIKEIAWLTENPFIIFSVGIVTLFITGKLYTKLK